MLFSSWTFLVYFLPAFVAVFYLLPHRFETARKLWLIGASLFFYGYWRLEYVPLLVGSILGNYAVAELIIRCSAASRAKAVLTAGVVLNLLLLGYFKYTNFTLHFLGQVTHQNLGRFDIILPLAISFFTFTQISYLVDVYRERHLHYRFIDFSLFVVFFPHLIAGPIVRHWEIIPQFARREFGANRDNFGVGVTLLIFGLVKKYFADDIAAPANLVYDGVAQHLAVSSLDAWIGTICFSFQIYFDFSSYSDMAIGLARIFGIKFPYNFDSPYKATSIIVFWERWHRTLTRFLREYVYYTLGGNRRGHSRQILNIMATMLLSGLWHGAGWTFIVWGGLHGSYLVVNHQWRLMLKRLDLNPTHPLYRAAGVGLTFVAVTLGWVFFRSSNIHIAGHLLGEMLAFGGFSFPEQFPGPGLIRDRILGPVGFHFIAFDSTYIKPTLEKIAIFFIICWAMPNTQQLLANYDPILEPVSRPGWFRLRLGFWLGLALGLLAYLILRNADVTAPSPFIYFNF